MILNFTDYMKSCYTHLLSSLPKETNEEEAILYYKPVKEFSLEGAKTKIIEVLKDALDKEVITEDEYSAMNPEEKDA